MDEAMGYFEKLFDDSYERIMPTDELRIEFFDQFYQNLFNASPAIPRYFKDTDMQQQKKVIVKAFYALFTVYASHHADETLEKISVTHGKHHLNIRPDLYDLWLEAFIKTVRDIDLGCDDETELAWRLVLTPGIVYMKLHLLSESKYDKDHNL